MELHSILQDHHNFKLRLKYFSSHNRAAKFHATRLKTQRDKDRIPFLYHPSTIQKLSNTKQIAGTFADCYGSLYNLKDDTATPHPTTDTISSFLETLNLPSVFSSDSKDLNWPFSNSEILKVIRSLPNRKSPGPGGLSCEYYQTFGSKLAPYLAALVNKDINKAAPPPRDVKSAYHYTP